MKGDIKMDWGKVVYIFFALMSLTTTLGFLFDHNTIALFIAGSINLVSTFLKIGVKNILSAELFASSLVADLHLIPAFLYAQLAGDMNAAVAMAVGALAANVFSMGLVYIEASKTKEEF